ncbi:MAG: ATPase, T2SS/T4P/T4SS family [Thermoproteota archaeon]
MSETRESLVFFARRTWSWNARSRILYLSAQKIDSSLFCSIIHKLTHLSPRRIIVYLDDEWYEVNKDCLDFLKKCSQRVMEEKNKRYRALAEKNCDNYTNLDDIQKELCITPSYGTLYLKYLNQMLELNIPGELLTKCGIKDRENVFNKKFSDDHRYVIGHLLYSIDERNSLYRVSFLSDDYFWINKELSILLRYAYSEEMLRSGRLDQIYRHRLKTGLRFLNILTLREIEKSVKKSLVKHALYSSIGLSKIFPLIIDDNVQNFFLDNVGEKLYVDHAVFGRLDTNLKFQEKDFESFITLIKRESNLNLDYANPSIKTSIFFDKIPIRISVDIPPLTWGKGVIDVRKHMSNVLPLKYLLETHYFSPESAAFLIFATLNRANISIVGEPNSGKTSLLNFLSYFMPPWWRIVHIEDALETLPPRVSDQHRIVYIVEPLESREAKDTKTLEIIKVLHRTPSYLILGEIQTRGHVKAMFRAVSAGLRIMHTAHASDSNGFIKRLVKVYGIPELLIPELDLIINMKRLEWRNTVKRFISEIKIVDENSGLKKVYANNNFLKNSPYYDDLNASKIFRKLARLNCIEENVLQEIYEDIKRIIINHGFSENPVIRGLVLETYSKTLGRK